LLQQLGVRGPVGHGGGHFGKRLHRGRPARQRVRLWNRVREHSTWSRPGAAAEKLGHQYRQDDRGGRNSRNRDATIPRGVLQRFQSPAIRESRGIELQCSWNVRSNYEHLGESAADSVRAEVFVLIGATLASIETGPAQRGKA